MATYKVPSSVPQDLLLIQELVQPVETKQSVRPRASSIASSATSAGEGSDSEEEEVVEHLLEKDGDDIKPDVGPLSATTPSSDESSDSDSDSDSDCESGEDEVQVNSADVLCDDMDDEEDGGGDKHAAGVPLRTKNELPEPSVVVPDFSEVGANEPLEKVGEIMSIIENVVIVKGIPSTVENRAAERALDSDSLLVFEDRRVLGYVHETFGPTHAPMYQVKFPNAGAIDKTIVQLSRLVYHVPPRSNFVFPSQLARLKGSDASNVHDEEVGDDEVEFSDDEAEAAFKRQRARERRGSSVASSRHSTPIPSQLRDQELMSESLYGGSPFDEYTPYDMNSGTGPSRPAPLPYDDPYADEPPISQTTSLVAAVDGLMETQRSMQSSDSGRGRGRHNRGRGRGRANDERDNRRSGHGRDHDRRGSWRRDGCGGFHDRPHREGSSRGQPKGRAPRDSSQPRPLSPTSLAIARATGQFADGENFGAAAPSVNTYGGYSQQRARQDWQQPPYDQDQYQDSSSYHYQPYVQPHINPRFASQFGLNMNFFQPQQFAQGYQSSTVQHGMQYGGWDGTWSQNSSTQPQPQQNHGSAEFSVPNPNADNKQ